MHHPPARQVRFVVAISGTHFCISFFTPPLRVISHAHMHLFADANCDGTCAKGYYCPAASTSSTFTPCPAGRYRDTTGATAESDCTLCTAGHACSVSAMTEPSPCGSSNFYQADTGQTSCDTVSAGYYTSGGDSSATRTGQTLCEPGFYCNLGQRNQCPLGTYGSNSGETSALCLWHGCGSSGGLGALFTFAPCSTPCRPDL